MSTIFIIINTIINSLLFLIINYIVIILVIVNSLISLLSSSSSFRTIYRIDHHHPNWYHKFLTIYYERHNPPSFMIIIITYNHPSSTLSSPYIIEAIIIHQHYSCWPTSWSTPIHLASSIVIMTVVVITIHHYRDWSINNLCHWLTIILLFLLLPYMYYIAFIMMMTSLQR